MQPSMIKLICKLNESPESCQEELPWARLLVVLSRGAPQSALILLPMLPTLSALQLLIQTGIYIFIYIKKKVIFVPCCSSTGKKKGHGGTDLPRHITCFKAARGVSQSYPSQGENPFLQQKALGKEA